MKCYYCGIDIRETLSFCTQCYEPLISCPKCGRYFSPLANFCNQCSISLTKLDKPEYAPRNPLKLSDIFGTGKTAENPSINIQIKHLEDFHPGSFKLDPLFALGYIFVISQSGYIKPKVRIVQNVGLAL